MQETNAQKAYDYLRNRLIAGEYVPGTRLLYGPIGKELGISATPVREAIGQLANEGFVQLVPQLGAVVRQIRQEELIELYEMREALEPYAAARATERMGKSQLELIRQRLEQMQLLSLQVEEGDASARVLNKSMIKQFEQADLAFHMLIIEAAGNQMIMKTVANSHLLTRVFATDRHQYNALVLRGTCEDHRRIFTALERKKADAARDAMAVHIRNGLELTIAAASDHSSRWWDSLSRS